MMTVITKEINIDPDNLPTKVIWHGVLAVGLKRHCIIGDNGITYSSYAYSRFLGLNEKTIKHRIMFGKYGIDNPFLLSKKMSRRPKSNFGNPEWHKLSDIPRDRNLKKLETKKFDCLVKDKPAAKGKYVGKIYKKRVKKENILDSYTCRKITNKLIRFNWKMEQKGYAKTKYFGVVNG